MTIIMVCLPSAKQARNLGFSIDSSLDSENQYNNDVTILHTLISLRVIHDHGNLILYL